MFRIINPSGQLLKIKTEMQRRRIAPAWRLLSRLCLSSPLHPGVTRNVGSTPRGGASREHSKGLQTSLTRNNDVFQAATAVLKIMPEPRPALRSIIDFMFCVYVTGGCYRGRKQSGCSLQRPSLKKTPLLAVIECPQ